MKALHSIKITGIHHFYVLAFWSTKRSADSCGGLRAGARDLKPPPLQRERGRGAVQKYPVRDAYGPPTPTIVTKNMWNHKETNMNTPKACKMHAECTQHVHRMHAKCMHRHAKCIQNARKMYAEGMQFA